MLDLCSYHIFPYFSWLVLIQFLYLIPLLYILLIFIKKPSISPASLPVSSPFSLSERRQALLPGHGPALRRAEVGHGPSEDCQVRSHTWKLSPVFVQEWGGQTVKHHAGLPDRKSTFLAGSGRQDGNHKVVHNRQDIFCHHLPGGRELARPGKLLGAASK